MRVGEEAFVERDIEVDGVIGGHPVDRRLDLAAVGGLPAGGLGVIGAQQAGDLTVGADLGLGARDEVAGSKADLSPRRETEELLRRVEHEVVALDEQSAREGHLTGAGRSILRVVDRLTDIGPARSVIVDGQLVITTSIGSSTTMRRRAFALWCVRTNDSSSSISWVPLTLAMPIWPAKSRIAFAG